MCKHLMQFIDIYNKTNLKCILTNLLVFKACACGTHVQTHAYRVLYILSDLWQTARHTQSDAVSLSDQRTKKVMRYNKIATQTKRISRWQVDKEALQLIENPTDLSVPRPSKVYVDFIFTHYQHLHNQLIICSIHLLFILKMRIF